MATKGSHWFIVHGPAGNAIWLREDAVQVLGACADGGCRLVLIGGAEVFVRESLGLMERLLDLDLSWADELARSAQRKAR